MKFGKYLAARQLELPEYSSYFINYKQLKKLINALNNDTSTTLQDKKGSFFFRVERELEKVNDFYLEKESELRFRLDLLIEKKNKSIKGGLISKNSITFISLYDGFKKFSKDLDRLEQFVGLNETGFTKVLKKWDKKSKSSTRELYLTTAVNVQPIFHRNQIVELSDLVANNLMELEALSNGDKSYLRYHSKDQGDDLDGNNASNNNNNKTTESEPLSVMKSQHQLVNNKELENDINSSDQLYTDFYEITLQNANLPTKEQLIKLKDWSNQIISKLNADTKKYTFSKVFMLLVGNLQIPNESLLQFYEFFQEFIDLNFIDDLNGRTCLIEASTCQNGRTEILEICLSAKIDPSIKDVTGRSCLHYLSESGRDDMLTLVLAYIKEHTPEQQVAIIDAQDNESTFPLLLAIINDHESTVKLLLEYQANGFPKQNDAKPMYLPLNVACKFGNLKIVELLLHQYGSAEKATIEGLLTNASQSNAEGLLPIHIVASSRNSDLVPLLLEYGADINQLDKLNKWSCIFYAVFTNDTKMTKQLIDYGADFNLKDEEGYNPLYYAIWEGNLAVFNVLLESMRRKKKEEKLVPDSISSTITLSTERGQKNQGLTSKDSVSLKPFNMDADIDMNNFDMIPELSLPPPIIPLRKYGHNFLEKKIFLKLSFYTNRYSINMFPNTFLTSIPGRVTVSNNELIPRNIMLPVLDNEKFVTFQLDSIDDESFEIDFELFPTFGTRLLAKATLTSSILKSQYPGLGVKNTGYLELPLLDVRLRTIGSLKFTYEMIYPYSGQPLEISMYDTYWKLSSSSDDDSKRKKEMNSLSFVTSSSLNGEYYGIHVCCLNDGTPVVCPKLQVEIAPGVFLPISLFNFEQLSSIIFRGDSELDSMKDRLRHLTADELKRNFHSIIAQIYLPLKDFLEIIDRKISLNLDIFFPSTYELENFDMKEFAFFSNRQVQVSEADISMQSHNSLNNFIDAILTDLFSHVRRSRNQNNNGSDTTRHVVLSSNNPSVCTILNWKQPNYPVFYNLNGLKYNKKSKQFLEATSNGILKSESLLSTSKSKISSPRPVSTRPSFDGAVKSSHRDEKSKISIDNIDSINKDSTEYTNLLDYDDKLTRSIKLAVNYACHNNLLGITVPERVLDLSPEIVKSILSKGLILVASKDDSTDDTLLANLQIPELALADGDGDIDLSNTSSANEELDNNLKLLDSDGEIRANGLRFKDILTFTDSIEV